MKIEPCVKCGGKSLAQLAGHICPICEDLYSLCMKCGKEMDR